MANIRPAPAAVEAKKREIARRYARKRKHASKTQFASIRLAELNRLFRVRHGNTLPDDETGRECLMIAAHHLVQLAGHPQQRFMAWAELYAPWLKLTEITAILTEIVVHPKTWKADSLAWRLRLTYADRKALKITTIGAIDVSKAQREAKRRKARREREKARRKARRAEAIKAVATIIGCLIWWARTCMVLRRALPDCNT